MGALDQGPACNTILLEAEVACDCVVLMAKFSRFRLTVSRDVSPAFRGRAEIICVTTADRLSALMPAMFANVGIEKP